MGLIKKGGTKGLSVPPEKRDATKQVETPGTSTTSDDAATPGEPGKSQDATRQVKARPPAEADTPDDAATPGTSKPGDATRQVQGKPGSSDATRQVQGKPGSSDATRQVQGKPGSSDATRQVQGKPGSSDATRQVQGKPGSSDATRQGAAPAEAEGSAPAVAPPATRSAPPPGTAQSDRSEKKREEPPQVLSAGTVLQSRYHIEGLIGIGGMSVVYRGRDLRFKEVVRHCAIKEMFQTVADSQTRMLNLQRFEREAGMLATFSHPAIPKVYDFFEEHGHCYLVMELVPGKDLEALIEENQGQPLNEERVLYWAAQLCDVLSYLHNNKPDPIVFRDMKPSNVLLTPDERIVLIDFGIARLFTAGNQKGTMIGTEGYAPPEQYRGIAEPQGDIYALGATLHHLLTGSDPRLETPFTFHERPIRQFNAAISPTTETAVMKALQYDMMARWATCEEFKNALPIAATSGGGYADMVSGIATAGDPNRSSGTELVWRFQCEEEVRSSPRVNGATLFVGCYDTNLYAIDVERGEFRWKYATDGGINASPAFWQDMVIIGSEDGTVYSLDIRRGHLRWSFRTERPIRSSPRVHDRVVLVGSDDRHFYALDGMRGSDIWKYRAWNPFRSTACVHEDSVYVGCDDSFVYCLDLAKGKLKWKQRTRQPVVSSPTYHEGLVFVGSLDSHLYALDSTGGFVAWRYRTGHFILSSPYVMGNTVYVGSADGYLYALDTRKGRLQWSYEIGGQVNSSPYVENGRVYVGAADGNVYCLDGDSGSLIWKYQTEQAVVSSPIVVNGVVYVGSLDTYIYALKA